MSRSAKAVVLFVVLSVARHRVQCHGPFQHIVQLFDYLIQELKAGWIPL